MDLLLDVKTLIAAYDQEVWYMLYRYDAAFHEYARSVYGISRFIELFTVKTVKLSNTKYRLFGRLHRCDLPAVTRADGSQEWYLNGKCHRSDDLPAIIRANGDQYWFWRGKQHRCDRPAALRADGEQWWRLGKLHRDDDLPAVINADGNQWHQHGQLHRCNLPAAIHANGVQRWYLHGMPIDPPI